MTLTAGFFTLIVVFIFVFIFALCRGDRVKTGFRFHGAELFLSYWGYDSNGAKSNAKGCWT